MSKKVSINTLIDISIENTFPFIKDTLLENKITYEKLKDSLLKIYSENLIALKNNFPNLYISLYENEKLYQIYYQVLFESYLINNYASNKLLFENDEKYIEEIELLSGASFIIKAALASLLFLFKIPHQVIFNFRKLIYKLGKKISKFGKDQHYINLFFNNIPKQCIDKLNTLFLSPLSKFYLKGDVDGKKLKTIFTNIFGNINEKDIKLQEEFIKCALIYLIKIVAIELMLFYKCLYDNKKFMDLVDIKKRPTESLLHIDKLGKYSIFEKSDSICVQEYLNFKKSYEDLTKIIETIFKGNNEKIKWAYSELDKAIQEANKYADKLLKEGKKKQDKKDKKR